MGSWPCRFLWPWVNCLMSLSLSFLICKLEIMPPPCRVVVKMSVWSGMSHSRWSKMFTVFDMLIFYQNCIARVFQCYLKFFQLLLYCDNWLTCTNILNCLTRSRIFRICRAKPDLLIIYDCSQYCFYYLYPALPNRCLPVDLNLIFSCGICTYINICIYVYTKIY